MLVRTIHPGNAGLQCNMKIELDPIGGKILMVEFEMLL